MEKSLFFVVLGGKLGHIQVVPWQTKRMEIIAFSFVFLSQYITVLPRFPAPEPLVRGI